ncbi:MAG: hypothetical protein ACKPKO_34520, partial [Candidatus Fonsibacter sp.]
DTGPVRRCIGGGVLCVQVACNKCYFKVKDVASGFNMSNLDDIILDKKELKMVIRYMIIINILLSKISVQPVKLLVKKSYNHRSRLLWLSL